MTSYPEISRTTAIGIIEKYLMNQHPLQKCFFLPLASAYTSDYAEAQ
jgi:hypothetical protein